MKGITDINKEIMAFICETIDSFVELLNGRALYNTLAGSLKMDNCEILAAGFTTLREFMGEDSFIKK